MDYYTHDGTYVISIGASNALPPEEEGVILVEGVPEGYGLPPAGKTWARFNIHSRQWEDPRSAEQKWEDAANAARTKRDRLLSQSDWTQMPDVTVENKGAWATYRQALRDVPEQVGFPFEIDWPDIPST
jgi:hypothetical protein